MKTSLILNNTTVDLYHIDSYDLNLVHDEYTRYSQLQGSDCYSSFIYLIPNRHRELATRAIEQFMTQVQRCNTIDEDLNPHNECIMHFMIDSHYDLFIDRLDPDFCCIDGLDIEAYHATLQSYADAWIITGAIINDWTMQEFANSFISAQAPTLVKKVMSHLDDDDIEEQFDSYDYTDFDYDMASPLAMMTLIQLHSRIYNDIINEDAYNHLTHMSTAYLQAEQLRQQPPDVCAQQTWVLQFKNNKSNKTYILRVDFNGTDYLLNIAYGTIGGTLKTKIKDTHAQRAFIEKQLLKLMMKKISEGYLLMDSNEPTTLFTPSAH